jgi:hypothetical protein|tara:strand:+ start:38 stop:193 length:156 start_codon:yes stop_codon:yes gene_type:complete
MFKKVIYCGYCDKLTKKQIKQINKKSIDFVTLTKQCEICKPASEHNQERKT